MRVLASWTRRYTPQLLALVGVALLLAVFPPHPALALVPLMGTMWPYQDTYLPALGINPAAISAGGDAGARKNMLVQQGAAIQYLDLQLTATATISAGSTARYLGSLLQCFDFVAFNENGDPIVDDVKMEIVRAINEAQALSAISGVRLPLGTGAATAAAYSLREIVRVPFAGQLLMRPQETAFIEKNPAGKTYLQVQFSLNAASNLITVPGNVTFTNVQVAVIQRDNYQQSTIPWFRPRIRTIPVPVAAAGVQQPIPINSDRWIGGIVLSQYAGTVGFVNDILQSFIVQSDKTVYWGNGQVPFPIIQQEAEETQGGAVLLPTPNNAHLVLPFQQAGRLSTMMQPNQQNLRIIPTAQPTAAAGATSSALYVTLLEYERFPAAFAYAGGQRFVTNPKPLPW